MWADSHCHLQYELPPGSLERAKAANVRRVVCVGTDTAHSAAAVEEAAKDPEAVWATVGVHPHDASEGVDGIVPLLASPGVVAVGECGLDYHYDHSPRDVQRQAFAAQIAMAAEHDLALVIHTREAWDDTFAILASEALPDRVVFHCFTGGVGEARRALDTGGYLSFSGIVTFKGAAAVREAAAMAPLDRVLVETDAPYLAPVPHRGEPNEPAYVALVGAAVAAEMGRPVDEIEAATWANTHTVFGRPTSA